MTGNEHRGSERILLVEDETSVRQVAAKILERSGYTVTSVAVPAEALDLFSEAGGGFDLLLTDVVMPDMSGAELAERIKRLNPDLRVLFMSGYPTDVLSPHGVLEGETNLVGKPFSPDTLALAVRQVLDDD